jgi:hypothetical protein
VCLSVNEITIKWVGEGVERSWGDWFRDFKIRNQFIVVNEGFYGQQKMIFV